MAGTLIKNVPAIFVRCKGDKKCWEKCVYLQGKNKQPEFILLMKNFGKDTV